MLSLYPFAPSIISDSIFSSPFDHLIDDDFGGPISSRRYVLPRRRYVYRHSPYDLDALIDHMAGLTADIADDRSPADESGKGRRRSRSRNGSPRLSPRRTPNNNQIKSAEEKTDVDMSAETKTMEPPSASPTPQTPTESNNSSTVNATSPTTVTAAAAAADAPTNNAVVGNTNTATTASTVDKPTSVSPFRLIKQLNGLQLTLTTSDTAYTVTTPIPPSLSKPDLQLSVDNHFLTLSAQIKSAQTNADGKTESSSNVHISRSIRLNRDANTEGITAHISEGHLTITIPRTPSEKKQTINIE